MDIETVGVMGAGGIGIGVAQNLAQSGFKVILVDVQESILADARAKIRENIRLVERKTAGAAS